MKVKVINTFIDKETKRKYKPDEMIEFDEKRIKDIEKVSKKIKKKLIEVVENGEQNTTNK